MSLDLLCRDEVYLVVQAQRGSMYMHPTRNPSTNLSVEVDSILLLRLYLRNSIDVVLVADLVLA